VPVHSVSELVDYLKKVLDGDAIPYIVAGREPSRMNLVARLKGNGSKRPLIIMGHTDTVKVHYINIAASPA